jgi:hypothetical protein
VEKAQPKKQQLTIFKIRKPQQLKFHHEHNFVFALEKHPNFKKETPFRGIRKV